MGKTPAKSVSESQEGRADRTSDEGRGRLRDVSEDVRRGAERAAAEIRRGYERASQAAREEYEKAARDLRRGDSGPTAFAAEATRLRQRTGLSAAQIARATGAAPSTVRGWIGRHSEPKGVRAERVAELAAITERLERVMPRSYIPVWLSKPIEALDDEKPLDLIATGEYKRVAKVISAIEDPGAI